MKSLLYLILILIAVACTEISYKEPQPRGKKSLSEIPAELRGSYLLRDEKSSNADTLVISAKSFYQGGDPDKASVEYLSDRLVLKYFKGYYFFNKNGDPEWFLRVLRQDSNGDLHYLSMETDDQKVGDHTFEDFLRKLNATIKVDTLEVDGKKLYQIDPSPKQLVGLIKDGYFKEEMLMKKIK
jgi:hypothetical protein